MDTTPRQHLPYIAPQQAQKQVTYSEAMRLLDLLVQPAALCRSLGTPPAEPAEGESHVVVPRRRRRMDWPRVGAGDLDRRRLELPHGYSRVAVLRCRCV